MSKRPPTHEEFEKLLLWLDPDRDKAAEKYERIRHRLITIFDCKGCCDAENLGDRTIDVVCSKIDWLIENYVGDPALYFYGVAQNIYRESLKTKFPQPPPPPDPTPPEVEEISNHLDECLKELSSRDRDLIMRYHEGQGRWKILNRKKLAEELRITLNALRIKAYHIHSRLRKCVESRAKSNNETPWHK